MPWWLPSACFTIHYYHSSFYLTLLTEILTASVHKTLINGIRCGTTVICVCRAKWVIKYWTKLFQLQRHVKLWCNNIPWIDKNSEGVSCRYFRMISHISVFDLKGTRKTLLMIASHMEDSKCRPPKIHGSKVTATLTCYVCYGGNVFSSWSFLLFFLHLVISRSCN
jgi:hypothetical protein